MPQDMSAVTFTGTTGTYYNQLIKRENCKLLEPLLEVRYVAMAVHTAVATANSLSETRKQAPVFYNGAMPKRLNSYFLYKLEPKLAKIKPGDE